MKRILIFLILSSAIYFGFQLYRWHYLPKGWKKINVKFIDENGRNISQSLKKEQFFFADKTPVERRRYYSYVTCLEIGFLSDAYRLVFSNSCENPERIFELKMNDNALGKIVVYSSQKNECTIDSIQSIYQVEKNDGTFTVLIPITE